MKRKIVGIVFCTLLIATAFSVVGIDENRDRLNEDYTGYTSEVSKPLNRVDDWPMFHHDLQHTGYSTDPAPETNKVLWTINFNVVSPPAVADDKVYFGTYNYPFVCCVDAVTGDTIWIYNTGDDTFWGGPTVVDDRVYIAGESFNFYCIDAETGELVWSTPILGGSASCPAIYEGKVYIGSADVPGTLYCLNAVTGHVIWTVETASNGVDSSPAVYEGKVYFGSYNHEVYCVDAETGAKIWNYTTNDEIYSSPAVYDGKVYIGSGLSTNYLYCLDAETGEEIWISILTSYGVLASPAVAYGKVYINSLGTMYCLDAESGEEIWDNSIGYDSMSSPAVADGKVYYGSGGSMICLDAETGESIWEYDMGTTWTYSSPAVVNGRVYTGSSKFYTFGSLPPDIPTVSGPTFGVRFLEYDFTVVTADPDGDNVFYYIEWGDGTDSGWIGPYASGEDIIVSHAWVDQGTFEIRAKAKDINEIVSDWSNPLTINISGNQPPNKPVRPSGSTKGKVNVEYTYKSSTTDPDGDRVYYNWSWGDGNYSGWLGPCNSGVTVSAKHKWTVKGTYQIKVKAKDVYGAESDWSDPLPVSMPRNVVSINILLQRLFERFPNAFPILRHLMGL